jgi:hypothetical protein
VGAETVVEIYNGLRWTLLNVKSIRLPLLGAAVRSGFLSGKEITLLSTT